MRVLLILLMTTPNTLLSELSGKDYGKCLTSTSTGRQLSFSVNRKLNESEGHWVTSYSARKVDTESSSEDISLESTQWKTVCDGKTVIHIETLIKEIKNDRLNTSSFKKDENLLFHPRHGHNAVILENGRVVQKLELEDLVNAVVFTNRPLRNNELFEVRLEKRTTTKKNCGGIGVMTYSPDTVKIISAMNIHRNGTWMYHNNAIYQDAKPLVSNYGADLNAFQVRERVGVMRRDDGELHFFVNGVDQGLAASNMPENLYGVYELWYDAVKAKIVY